MTNIVCVGSKIFIFGSNSNPHMISFANMKAEKNVRDFRGDFGMGSGEITTHLSDHSFAGRHS